MSDFDCLVCVPTIVAKDLVFRFLNAIDLDCRFRLLVDPSHHRSVAEKWNMAIDVSRASRVPVIFANDDVVPWEGSLDTMLDAVRDGADFVVGKTTGNFPCGGEPEVLATGGFSLWAASHQLFADLAASERSSYPKVLSADFQAGRFDESFRPTSRTPTSTGGCAWPGCTRFWWTPSTTTSSRRVRAARSWWGAPPA